MHYAFAAPVTLSGECHDVVYGMMVRRRGREGGGGGGERGGGEGGMPQKAKTNSH